MSRIGPRAVITLACVGLIAVVLGIARCHTLDSRSHAGAARPSQVNVLHLLRPSELTDAERRFGRGATLDPTVTYQPAVVIVEQGAKAVRSLAANGLGCTLDARAIDADAVQPGRIVLATSRCVGRVLAARRAGDQLALTLGPVEITDIVREGNFQLDQPVDFDEAQTFNAPEWPGAASDIAPLLSDATDFPTIVPASYYPSSFEELRPSAFMRVADEGPVAGNATMANQRAIGARIRSERSGAVFRAEVTLHLATPRLHFALQISNAKVTRCELQFYGAAGLTMGLEAASKTGGNINVIYDVPGDITIPIGGAVPFSVLVHQRFVLQTAFAAANTLIKDFGDYTFEGSFSLGYRDGEWSTGGPTGFSIKESPLAWVNGVSLATAGAVLTHEVKIMVGIGAFGFATGPYTAFDSTIAVARGSDAQGTPLGGSPVLRGLAPCRQATLTISLAVGIGYIVPKPITDAINSVLSALNIDYRVKRSGGLYTAPVDIVKPKIGWDPDVPTCKLI